IEYQLDWYFKEKCSKTCFQSIYKVVIPAIAKSHSIKEDILETCCEKWFRGAVDRDGGRIKRY
ncbi:unnamed protein product, partial [Allacma fusca]